MEAGEWRRDGPGTFVSTPPGIGHGFRFAGESRLGVLNVHAPDTDRVDRLQRP